MWLRRTTRLLAASAAAGTVAVSALPASGRAAQDDAYPVYGGPALTAYDDVSGDAPAPGYQVERQALNSSHGSASASPFRALSTAVQQSGKRQVVTARGTATAGYAAKDPGLLTSFSIGQEQNDYGTLAITANVSTDAGSVKRHSTGRVWVETHCGSGYCWANLGGAALSAPTVVNADGAIWVFARFAHGVRGKVRPRGSSAWSSWRSLGTSVKFRDAPAASTVAATHGKDNVEVLATGKDGAVYRQLIRGIGKGRAHQGTVTRKWTRVSPLGLTEVGPAIAYNEMSSTLVMVVVGAGGSVETSTDGGVTWQQHPGVEAAAFAPAALGDNITVADVVAVRGQDNRTYVTSSSDGGQTFGDWSVVPCTGSGSKRVC